MSKSLELDKQKKTKKRRHTRGERYLSSYDTSKRQLNEQWLSRECRGEREWHDNTLSVLPTSPASTGEEILKFYTSRVFVFLLLADDARESAGRAEANKHLNVFFDILSRCLIWSRTFNSHVFNLQTSRLIYGCEHYRVRGTIKHSRSAENVAPWNRLIPQVSWINIFIKYSVRANRRRRRRRSWA